MATNWQSVQLINPHTQQTYFLRVNDKKQWEVDISLHGGSCEWKDVDKAWKTKGERAKFWNTVDWHAKKGPTQLLPVQRIER
jgi:hypothetical protein